MNLTYRLYWNQLQRGRVEPLEQLAMHVGYTTAITPTEAPIMHLPSADRGARRYWRMQRDGSSPKRYSTPEDHWKSLYAGEGTLIKEERDHLGFVDYWKKHSDTGAHVTLSTLDINGLSPDSIADRIALHISDVRNSTPPNSFSKLFWSEHPYIWGRLLLDFVALQSVDPMIALFGAHALGGIIEDALTGSSWLSYYFAKNALLDEKAIVFLKLQTKKWKAAEKKKE
ncbi:hypothetical protein HZB01_03970 [Candidatus Woesearchaeota archaeon]|nr:hypothetical protein [Candidatus Woesearchaeota archaeon]